MTDSDGDVRRGGVILTVLVLLVLAQGTYFAHFLVPWDDESGYLVLGALAAEGRIDLFQDEMLGERPPLPFYVLGVSQVLFGKSLIAARLWSLALGIAAAALVFEVGRHVGGLLCGVLSGLFLATQAMVVAYFATAMYHALCSLLIAGGLYMWFVARSPVAAMAAFSLLTLTRPNMAVMVPLVLVLLLMNSRERRERWALVAVAAAPPVWFFLSDPQHLKMLAYVPLVNRLVKPLGYHSLFELGGSALLPDRQWSEGVLWFVRRYLFWCAAGAGLVAMSLANRFRKGRRGLPACPEMRIVAVLFAYTLTWQWVILHQYFKSVAAWTASLAPLPALLLGYHAAILLRDREMPLLWRRALVAGLVAVFLLSPTFSTHSAMPSPLPVAGTTVSLLNELSEGLAEQVPAGTRVFLVGMSLPAYLAGIDPYLQQIIHGWTLVPAEDPSVLVRSGLWGRREIDRWLGQEASYAVIQPGRMNVYRAIGAYRDLVDVMETEIDAHFSLLAEVAIDPFQEYRVYQRRFGAGRVRASR
jgi:4-amino-4-deoxy-L-arabinose transferase-like glycosyltransferase